MKKSILCEMIRAAIEACEHCGSGDIQDTEISVSSEWDPDIRVTADWVECDDDPGKTVIEINIFQNNIIRLSYREPETVCEM